MQIKFHKQFTKQYDKLPEKIRRKFDERLVVFIIDPFTDQLSNHALNGKYEGLRSINVTGDMRALYRPEGNTVRFMLIDNHNNLYN